MLVLSGHLTPTVIYWEKQTFKYYFKSGADWRTVSAEIIQMTWPGQTLYLLSLIIQQQDQNYFLLSQLVFWRQEPLIEGWSHSSSGDTWQEEECEEQDGDGIMLKMESLSSHRSNDLREETREPLIISDGSVAIFIHLLEQSSLLLRCLEWSWKTQSKWDTNNFCLCYDLK